MNPLVELLNKVGPMGQAMQKMSGAMSMLKNPMSAMTGDPRMKQVMDYFK